VDRAFSGENEYRVPKEDDSTFMRYKLLGNSGLRVSELALGTISFGDENGRGVADETVSRRLFDLFREAGGNFIDTANDYTGGKSETHLGKFTSSSMERDRLVIATKYSANMRPDDPNGGGNSRKSGLFCVFIDRRERGECFVMIRQRLPFRFVRKRTISQIFTQVAPLPSLERNNLVTFNSYYNYNLIFLAALRAVIVL
jgi:Aldo/keto reductase family